MRALTSSKGFKSVAGPGIPTPIHRFPPTPHLHLLHLHLLHLHLLHLLPHLAITDPHDCNLSGREEMVCSWLGLVRQDLAMSIGEGHSLGLKYPLPLGCFALGCGTAQPCRDMHSPSPCAHVRCRAPLVPNSSKHKETEENGKRRGKVRENGGERGETGAPVGPQRAMSTPSHLLPSNACILPTNAHIPDLPGCSRAGFEAPTVVVSYTDDADIQNGKKFAAAGCNLPDA